MAAVGQGDPRWIVQDRADGVNVGNWHWTDKSYTDWFVEQLKSRLCNKSLDADGVTLKTLEMSKCDLEASLRNRKARVNIFVDGNFVLDWEGTVDGVTVKGTSVLHDLDPDFDDSYEIEVRITSGSGAAAEKVLATARKQTRAFIRKEVPALLQDYIDHTGLKAMQNAGRLQVAGADARDARGQLTAEALAAQKAAGGAPSAPTPAPAPAPAAAPVSTAAPSKKEAGPLTSFSYRVKWGAPARVIFDTLLTPGQLSATTRSPSTVERKEGGAITVLGGAIKMEITKLVEGEELCVRFRGADWKEGVWIKVRLSFETASDACTMEIKHEDIPAEDFERTKGSWSVYGG